VIISVEDNSPARRAGLQQGDIIIRFGGEIINSSAALYKMLTRENVFEPAPITVIRHGQLLELVIEPGEKKMLV
jgi:S1-C subfamily serine protease